MICEKVVSRVAQIAEYENFIRSCARTWVYLSIR